MNMLLGKRIRALRRFRGYNQAQLAEKIDMTRSYLTKLELGHEHNISCKFVVALSKALKCKPGDIYEGL